MRQAPRAEGDMGLCAVGLPKGSQSRAAGFAEKYLEEQIMSDHRAQRQKMQEYEQNMKREEEAYRNDSVDTGEGSSSQDASKGGTNRPGGCGLLHSCCAHSSW